MSSAVAQQNAPHAGYVFPAGGQRGTSFEVVVGGQYLAGVTNTYFSGTGAKATVLEYVRPMTQQEANNLRQRMTELRQQLTNNPPPGAARELAEIRAKLASFARRPPNPAIAETVTLKIDLATNLPPGRRELRLGTPAGLSNPLLFCIGTLPEYRKEPEPALAPNAPIPPAVANNPELQRPAAPTESAVNIPVIVNGQMPAGGVDRFRFYARQGTELVAAVSARALIPYLADAVPGWFQATLALCDANGKQLAYDDDYQFHPDPAIHYRIPKDGEYVVEIKDSIYRGRDDFVYRIALGELPFVTDIFPLGGPAGTETTVELHGWNLPVTLLNQDSKDRAPGVYALAAPNNDWFVNTRSFAVDDLPECLEQEPNNSPAQAQRVTLPIIVNGRIDPPGDQDVFRFEGRAGDQIVADVLARRLDSPLDSMLKLTDAKGRPLAVNDDHDDKAFGLLTHQADSYLTATLPSNGTYYVYLGDTQRHGGPAYAYRLRLSAPRPNFALRVTPSSVNVRAGASAPLTVYALRQDGFTNAISLVSEDAPPGFKLSGTSIPAGQDQLRLTLTVPLAQPEGPMDFALRGFATIEGNPVVRHAVPAEDMMQAFAYRHLVPAQEMKLAVLQRALPRANLRILSATPLKIPSGGTARILIGTPVNRFPPDLQVELSNPPEGIKFVSLSPVTEGMEIVVKTDASKIKPGLKGNLIFNATAQPPAAALAANTRTNAAVPPRPANARGAQRRQQLGTLPAIAFEIVAAE